MRDLDALSVNASYITNMNVKVIIDREVQCCYEWYPSDKTFRFNQGYLDFTSGLMSGGVFNHVSTVYVLWNRRKRKRLIVSIFITEIGTTIVPLFWLIGKGNDYKIDVIIAKRAARDYVHSALEQRSDVT
jgi:hypothetical protein